MSWIKLLSKTRKFSLYNILCRFCHCLQKWIEKYAKKFKRDSTSRAEEAIRKEEEGMSNSSVIV